MDTEFVSMRELRKRFSCSRQFVSFLALREGWTKIRGSRPRFYLAADVADFEVARKHTELAKANGLVIRGLIRHKNGHSAICPVCKKESTSNEVLPNDGK